MSEINENMPDEALVCEVRRGNEKAFKVIFLRYYEPLAYFARRYVKKTDVAEDLVQEVFARVWEERDTWDPGSSVKVFLFQVVKHRSLDYLKHLKVEHKYDGQWMDQQEPPSIVFDESNSLQEFRGLVRAAVEELPDKAREIYKLNRYEGLTYKEIALLLDISVKTVESQMARSLQKLRNRLSPYLSLVTG